MSHGEARLCTDWPKRIGLVILALTSLMVVAGIVTAAYRGKLVGTPTGYGAIVLPWVVLTHILLLVRRSGPSWVIGLVGAPAAFLSAFYWLSAVAT